MTLGERSVALHEQHRGKLFTGVPFVIDSKDMLSQAYTPGVAEPCRVIANDVTRVYDLTIKGHTVAVITDGTAVLGLGDIGPEASLPVMEGKCALFKQFGGLDAFPIAIRSKDVDEIVDTVTRIAPIFGGINLEDISAPRCFEIERRLKEALDIPVMHDDQHGTAVVILAGLTNALKVVSKRMKDIRVCISGAGAAGTASAHLLHTVGVSDIIVVDSKGVLHAGRGDMNQYKRELIRYNTRGISGDLASAVAGTDVFIGVSAPGILTSDMVRTMNPGAIVFAMANPTPEIMPDLAREAGAAVVATGRSDYANQVNNVIAYPGIFKGALRIRARDITDNMKIAAAHALARCVEVPTAERIIPDVFTEGLADKVAEAVVRAA